MSCERDVMRSTAFRQRAGEPCTGPLPGGTLAYPHSPPQLHPHPSPLPEGEGNRQGQRFLRNCRFLSVWSRLLLVVGAFFSRQRPDISRQRIRQKPAVIRHNPTVSDRASEVVRECRWNFVVVLMGTGYAPVGRPGKGLVSRIVRCACVEDCRLGDRRHLCCCGMRALFCQT